MHSIGSYSFSFLLGAFVFLAGKTVEEEARIHMLADQVGQVLCLLLIFCQSHQGDGFEE